MLLNRIFLSPDSIVDIHTNKSSSEVRNLLGSNFERTRNNLYYKLPEEHQYLTANFGYYINKNKIRIHFAKELRRQFNHPFQVNYPRFIGDLTEENGKVRMKGQIGFRDWVFVFPIIWFAFFIFIYMGWLQNPEEVKDGEFAIYFILFGLLSFLIGLIRVCL